MPIEFKPSNLHQAYLYNLEKANLLETALGRDWQNASERSLASPLKVETPFAEDFYFDPSEANAIGYLISVEKGQKVDIAIEMGTKDPLQTFLDVFRVNQDETGNHTHIASSALQDTVLSFEARIASDYIIRFQTELLRGGRFRVHIQRMPSLDFPVLGKDRTAIGSLFGAPRDGGRRKHHGVDIFARRHTPIIAPTDGYIRFSGERGLGGNVIWMRDRKRDQTLYFAHLHDINVSRGSYISKGDTLGTVGNTGNARTTPPHLHFGIYQNGPVDPFHYIANTRTRMKRELADKSIVGKMIRTKMKSELKILGTTTDTEKIDLSKFQIMENLGASAASYRVKLPNNIEGYISHSSVELANRPIKSIVNTKENYILSSPDSTGIDKEILTVGEEIKVLGGFANYSFVKNISGEEGWIKM